MIRSKKAKKYSYLVNRQFQVNKRKSFLTLTGITLGIILFVTVNYLSSFMKELDIKDAIYRNGNYHAVMKNLSDKQINSLKYNAQVEECGFYSLVHSEKVEVKDQFKRLAIYSLDEKSINFMFNSAMEIVEGRYPNKLGEITLSSVGKNELNKTVGEAIKIGTEIYEIVGFYEGRSSNPLEIQGITLFQYNEGGPEVNGVITVKKKRDIINTVQGISKDIGMNKESYESEVGYNVNLLYAYGQDYSQYGTMKIWESLDVLLINLCILVFTIILTYGSINVSMKERIKQFSLLRCIGASTDKIKYLLIKESIVLGSLAIIPGVIIGHLIVGFIIKFVFQHIIKMNLYDLNIVIYWQVILQAIVLTFIIIFVATIIPVIQSRKITPLIGITYGDTSIKKVKIRKSKIIRRLFGYEGEIAYKNIRGNNRNFILTTILLSSLLIIFVVFTGFYNFSKSKYIEQIRRNNGNVQIRFYSSWEEGNEKESQDKVMRDLELSNIGKDILRNTRFLQGVSSVIKISKPILVEGVQSNEVLENEHVFDLNGNKFSYSNYGMINIFDEASLEEIIPFIDGTVEGVEDFNNNGIAIINPQDKKRWIRQGNITPYKIEEGKNINIILEKITNESLYYNPTETGLINTLKDSFQLQCRLLGSINYFDVKDYNSYKSNWGLNIIGSTDFYERNKEIFNRDEFSGGNITLNFKYKKGYKTKENIETVKKIANELGGDYIDYEESVEESKRSLEGMAVITYTILFLAMSIGIINILNNKIISISLRTKEFGAMISIGMSKKKLRKIILMEGIIQWFISTLIGSSTAYLALNIMHIINFYVGTIEKIKLPIWSIAIGVIILLIVNLICSLISLKKVETMEITDLIREKE